MDQNDDWKGLCSFILRSRYDVVQPRSEVGWGPAWTFTGHDTHAAEQAGWQMKRMGVTRLRHACRVQIHNGLIGAQNVAIVTELPGRTQIVLDLMTAQVVNVPRLYIDEALLALEGAAGLRLHPVAEVGQEEYRISRLTSRRDG